jgi:hypothetical protein
VSFFSLAFLTGLCLVIRPLQGYAVIGLALMFYLWPIPTTGLSLLSAVTYLFWRYRK